MIIDEIKTYLLNSSSVLLRDPNRGIVGIKIVLDPVEATRAGFYAQLLKEFQRGECRIKIEGRSLIFDSHKRKIRFAILIPPGQKESLESLWGFKSFPPDGIVIKCPDPEFHMPAIILLNHPNRCRILSALNQYLQTLEEY